MAARKNNKVEIYIPPIPWETQIEVFVIKGERILMKRMTFKDWYHLKKIIGWQYLAFEPGFCSLKPTE